jgi:hypothetical protein
MSEQVEELLHEGCVLFVQATIVGCLGEVTGLGNKCLQLQRTQITGRLRPLLVRQGLVVLID